MELDFIAYCVVIQPIPTCHEIFQFHGTEN